MSGPSCDHSCSPSAAPTLSAQSVLAQPTTAQSTLAPINPLPPIDPLGLTAEAYADATARLPLPKAMPGSRVGAIERYRRFYRDGITDQPHIGPGPRPLTRTHESESHEGTVRKFCQALELTADGKQYETESVLIPMIGKKRILTHTLCLSSQVGCAMGCGFCQTAQMGKLRDLTAAEIVGQWYAARHLVGCDTVRNIVFMGMGEPTDNLENVMKAVEILTDRSGPNLPMSKITISTVGNADGIRAMASRIRTHGWHRLSLAVSINAPNDEIRSQIMPINRKWPMRELRQAILEWPLYSASKICFEYVLIPGVNDAREHATQVADFILGRAQYADQRARQGADPSSMMGALHGLINLIPYNPRDNSPWPAPSEADADKFLGWLIEEGVFAKRRRTKGRDTMAACGQLGNPELRRRPIRPTISVSQS